MASGFGARLRAHREQRQVSLASIAERTKIKVSLLEGLERDDLSNWPAGIFRRSYIRAYAQAVGLDPDAVLREFLELYPEPPENDVQATLAAARGLTISRRPPTRLHLLIGSAIAALRSESAPRRPPGPPDEPAAELAPAVKIHHPDADLPAVADLFMRLARAADERDVARVLEDASSLLGAIGLIVWIWDPQAGALAPGLAHGYSDEMLMQLPRVRRDADNAIAAAFRSGEARVVERRDQPTGAVVAPLVTPTGSAGVLALEFQNGEEERPAVRALAIMLAAQLSTLVATPLARAATA